MTQGPIQPQQQYPPQHPLEENTLSLMDILLVLSRHLKLIIITPTIFYFSTIIYILFYTEPLYVSTATFMPSGSGVGTSQMHGLASKFGFSLPSSGSSQWSYTDVIQSRTLARGVLDHIFDTDKYGPQKSLLQILTYGDAEPTVGIDTLIKSGIGALQGMIEISSSPTIYELEISAFEPQLAADVANAVMEELDKHLREYNARKNTQTRQFIEERLVETKIELEVSEEALKEFRERNRNILNSPQLQLAQERIARDVAVLIGVFTTLKQQLETAKIDEVTEYDYVIIVDEPETPLYPAKPNKKQMKMVAGLLGIGLSILLAFIKEYFRNSDEAEQVKIGKAKSLIIKNITDFLPRRFKNIKNIMDLLPRRFKKI